VTVVTGIRTGGYVEFNFLYGDPDLAVELVLPADAFREFSIENGCIVALADDRHRLLLSQLTGLQASLLPSTAHQMEPRA
jgi:hypothetical protein